VKGKYDKEPGTPRLRKGQVEFILREDVWGEEIKKQGKKRFKKMPEQKKKKEIQRLGMGKTQAKRYGVSTR